MTLETDGRGHRRWRNPDPTGKPVYVHRLVAVAHGVIDPEDTFDPNVDIHHLSRVPWDNRPTNLVALSRTEHAQRHAESPTHPLPSERERAEM
jgi:hypothetical protein